MLGEECYLPGQGNFDLCITNGMDESANNLVGCTSPFGNDPEHICTNESEGKAVHELIRSIESLKYEQLKCAHPCSYFLFNFLFTNNFKYDDTGGALHFTFDDRIKVMRSKYDFNELSLVAEVGGYVGLFLGANFLQISDFVTTLLLRYF